MPGPRRTRLLSERRPGRRLAGGRLALAGPVLLVAPLLGFMGVFYLLPVAAMLLRSVSEPGWTLANFVQLTGDGVFLQVLGNTLRTALLVTAGTLLLGYPVAFAMARMGRRLATLTLVIVLLPFWTSVLVRSYAWMVLLGRHGVINEALMAVGAIEIPGMTESAY